MSKIFIKYLTYFTLFFILSPQDALAMSSRPTRQISYPVRVAVITDASEIALTIKGDYRIYSLPLLELLKEGANLNKVTVEPTYSGMSMEGEQFKIYGIKIRTDDTTDICINDRKFRGEMDIIRTRELRVLVINHLDIEDYIGGVLYHEVSHWWPMEALKAQAIAARTFAIYKSLEAVNKEYDLRSDIYSQVYGGKTAERFRTVRAVEETAGKILVYKQEILPAYYHATCGGHTENASLLWNTSPEPLKGRPCRYCEMSPHFNWFRKLSLDSVEKCLNEAGYKIRDIKEIETSPRDASGRVKTVSVIDSLGVEKMPANKFRLAIGPNVVKSANFTVRVQDGDAIFEGKGWGHGVGMCQWGAYFMARRGLETADILRFYYPGARIVDLKDMVK